jgi:predicted RNA-binding Zn ribbon-like protein
VTPYRWTSIGGHLALDLCNTLSWRLAPARRVDRLRSPHDLIDWFGAVSALAAADRDRLTQSATDHPRAAEKALQDGKLLRDAGIRIIDAQLDGVLADPAARTADVDLISTAWRRALAVASTSAQLPWRWQVEPTDPASLVHVLALSVADLLHQPDQSRLRRCDGEGCGWLFLDTTRNHSRRWCDPLDCGNRARVRSYTQRHRTPKPPGETAR